MSAIEPAVRPQRLTQQVPAFAMVGAFGFVVDSGITYALARGLGADPFLARFPAFAVATVLNFLLNRSLTFAGARTPILRAFLRYCLVCGVGLAVNWTFYALSLAAAQRLGLPTPPETLPVFVAFGTGVAMFATFFGFKFFAFRA